MRIVVALGGNALLRRSDPMTTQVQRRNIQIAAQALAPLAAQHSLIVVHGNGPHVGLLSLQAESHGAEPYPLDSTCATRVQARPASDSRKAISRLVTTTVRSAVSNSVIGIPCRIKTPVSGRRPDAATKATCRTGQHRKTNCEEPPHD